MIREWIIEWFINNSAVQKEDINLYMDKNYLEVELIDSFGFLALIGACEEKFAISFTEEDFSNDSIFTIEGLIKIISDKN